MQTSSLILVGIIGVWILITIALWAKTRMYASQIHREEYRVIQVYWQKTYKIPALIEILRLYEIQEKAFVTMITLHEKSLGIETQSIYDILENNKRVQREFQLLMTLANTLPEMQKSGAFVAIREHIISLERTLR